MSGLPPCRLTLTLHERLSARTVSGESPVSRGAHYISPPDVPADALDKFETLQWVIDRPVDEGSA